MLRDVGFGHEASCVRSGPRRFKESSGGGARTVPETGLSPGTRHFHNIALPLRILADLALAHREAPCLELVLQALRERREVQRVVDVANRHPRVTVAAPRRRAQFLQYLLLATLEPYLEGATLGILAEASQLLQPVGLCGSDAYIWRPGAADLQNVVLATRLDRALARQAACFQLPHHEAR